MILFFYGSIIAGIVLYVNIIDTIKKVKRDEETSANTIFGVICVAFILYSLFAICGR